MLEMTLLALAAALWVGVHFGIAGTVARARIVALTGENAFRIGYSLLSVGAIVLLVQAWGAAPYVELWVAPDWLRWLLAALMLPAFVLFVASVATPNPTAVAGKLGEAGVQGIQRVTRHPMLWSFAIWGAVHLIGKGTLGGVFFFGAFLVTALAGMPSIDRKVAAREPETWARLAPSTSILPFGAILAGRNRLALGEIPRFVWAVAGVAWLALLLGHAWIFGYPALPF
jgi:uncharacterized membrane protein